MSQYGSLQNHLAGQPNRPGEAEHEWQVGDGCTALSWTDRRAFTVVEVISPTHIRIQRDKAHFTPGSMGTSVDRYEAQPHEDKIDVKHGAGGWRIIGPTGRYRKAGGERIIPGRSEYHDPSF